MNEIKTYLMFDGNLYKIGKSKNPEQRLKQLKTGNPRIELIAITDKIEEKFLHDRFYQNRVNGEWFLFDEIKLKSILHYFENGNKIIGKYGLDWSKEVSRMILGNKKSDKLSGGYVINFGKYKGMLIQEMQSNEQYDYCVWYLEKLKKELSRSEKKTSRKYKAFYWLVNKKYEVQKL